MKLADARAILEGAECILVDEGTVTAVNAVQEASDIIHQSCSDFVKERQMNEGFFKDKYTKYKDAVISILKKEFGMVFPSDKIHTLEDWIRDYFVDKFDEIDCARAIRDNFKRQFALGESMKLDEAVETLQKAGFICENGILATYRLAVGDAIFYEYDITPDELQNILEKYDDLIQEFWIDGGDPKRCAARIMQIENDNGIEWS
jgi:hypothetical protein